MRVFNRILQLSFLYDVASVSCANASPFPFSASPQELPGSRTDSIHHGLGVVGTEVAAAEKSHNVSIYLFAELEELSRVVDIAYCVGVTGVYAPFECAGRCADFPEFQLVDTWNTGPLMSDSCGYIALDHGKHRIVIAFRGTYSIANTIVDLSTIPQEYVPYPGDPDEPQGGQDDSHRRHPLSDLISRPWKWLRERGNTLVSAMGAAKRKAPDGPKCNNCTVHTGFLSSWQNTRPIVLPHVDRLIKEFPTYELHLVGHSLGGAVAALAGLELQTKGLNPTVTTFGEPRIGNQGLTIYLDTVFGLDDSDSNPESQGRAKPGRYRRITHIDDPIPLLPLTEWGFLMHAGEIYISKAALSPTVHDLRLCDGDEDPNCIASGEDVEGFNSATATDPLSIEKSGQFDPAFWDLSDADQDAIFHFLNTQPRTSSALIPPILRGGGGNLGKHWGIPARYKMWQLFFAHRDYFWRLGLCLPGGDPFDWGRDKYGGGDGGDGVEEDGEQEDHGKVEELK